MGILKVVAAVVDTKQLTLYTSNGETTVIPQGDPRVRKIIDEVLPTLELNGIADLDLSEPNVYSEFEEKTGGLVKFFRVAKSKVKQLFGTSDEQAVAPTGSFGQKPAVLGMVKDSTGITAGGTVEQPFKLDRPAIGGINGPSMSYPSKMDAVEEIMQHAKVTDQVLKPDETIVAVIEGKAVPGVEQLKSHFNHSNLHGSPEGIANLLRRLGAVIDRREHSVDDVLRFLEKGDLPVADDGTIIAYKRLKTKGGSSKETFYDCHTGNVPQKVGSRVVMDERLVDKNRRESCSNGLHIARRGYLRSFSGNICVIAKIAPEDVIAVPHGDANKVRVCAYHIIFQLDEDSFKKVTNNQAMTDTDHAKKLVARAISGDHVGILEEVRVTEHGGRGIKITDLRKKGEQTFIAKTVEVPSHATAVEDLVDGERKLDAAPVSPKEVSQKVQEFQMPTTGSQKDKAAYLLKSIMSTGQALNMQIAATKALYQLKKSSKKSWDVLGVTASNLQIMEKLLKDEPAPVKASKKTKALSAAMKSKAPAIADTPLARTVAPAKAQPKQEVARPKPVAKEKPGFDQLNDRQKEAIRLVRLGKDTMSSISKHTGIHRRSIDRLILKFGR